MANESSVTPSPAVRLALRLAAELLVIVVGVLLALAADRWNQARGQEQTKREYLARLIDEIRADSAEAERAISLIPGARAARDSVAEIASSGGGGLVGTLRVDPAEGIGSSLFPRAAPRFLLPPVMAWAELNNTGLLVLLDDADERRPLAEYYAVRARVESALEVIEGRSRSAYMDALHRTGLLDGEVEPADLRRFSQDPEAEPLLRGLGSHLFSSEIFLSSLREAAVHTLERLTSAPD